MAPTPTAKGATVAQTSKTKGKKANKQAGSNRNGQSGRSEATRGRSRGATGRNGRTNEESHSGIDRRPANEFRRGVDDEMEATERGQRSDRDSAPTRRESNPSWDRDEGGETNPRGRSYREDDDDRGRGRAWQGRDGDYDDARDRYRDEPRNRDGERSGRGSDERTERYDNGHSRSDGWGRGPTDEGRRWVEDDRGIRPSRRYQSTEGWDDEQSGRWRYRDQRDDGPRNRDDRPIYRDEEPRYSQRRR
jgi:hypothetical protein